MPYKFIEGISMADVAFEASGSSLEKLFSNCALATGATMVRNIKKIKPKVLKKIMLSGENEEKLLHSFLEEIVFLKDAHMLIFNSFKIEIKGSKNTGNYILKAAMKGEKINPKKHDMGVDVKSITWHKFSLKKTPRMWKAVVLLDV